MDRGVTIIHVSIPEAAHGVRLDRALADAVPDLSRERVKALIAGGHVTGPAGEPLIDGSRKAAAGAAFALAVPAPEPAEAAAQDIPLAIVFEDEHLLVIDKPAGMVVHPAAGNLDGTLVNALLHHCEGQLSGIGGVARPGIVHRIDKDTSGLLVVAKSDRAHEGLARQFKAHSITRRYLALTSGRPVPPVGTVDAPLARSPSDRKKMAIVTGGKRAVTHYRTLQPLRKAALVECRLETGRTHQVRVHMAALGHALLGDPVYARVSNLREVLATLNFRRQALHATELGFIHPVESTALAFQSPMPADMQELFSHLDV